MGDPPGSPGLVEGHSGSCEQIEGPSGRPRTGREEFRDGSRDHSVRCGMGQRTLGSSGTGRGPLGGPGRVERHSARSGTVWRILGEDRDG